MKKTVILFAFFFVIFGVDAAYSPGFKLAVVNLQQALNETNEGKHAKQFIKNSVKQKQEIIKKKEMELKKEKDALDRLSPTSSGYDKKLGNYRKSVKNLKLLIQKIQSELSRKESAYSKNILDSLIEIIKQIRKEKGYDLILEVHSGVVDYNPAIDITKELIKRYNKLTSTKNR